MRLFCGFVKLYSDYIFSLAIHCYTCITYNISIYYVQGRTLLKQIKKYMQIIKTILSVVGGYLAFDFAGWVAWVLSGQIPPHGFYIGVITDTIVRFIINLIK